jgi:hypothetical protein
VITLGKNTVTKAVIGTAIRKVPKGLLKFYIVVKFDRWITSTTRIIVKTKSTRPITKLPVL